MRKAKEGDETTVFSVKRQRSRVKTMGKFKLKVLVGLSLEK